MLLADLESTCRDPLEILSPDNGDEKPRLGTPSIAALIRDVSSSMTLADGDRNAMIDAVRIAAEKRVEGILGHSRRHYGHAAMLTGQCVALAPTERAKDFAAWIAGLQQTHKRRHAFRQELKRAMEVLDCHADSRCFSASVPRVIARDCGFRATIRQRRRFEKPSYGAQEIVQSGKCCCRVYLASTVRWPRG